MQIHHVTLPAHDPKHVAAVLAEERRAMSAVRMLRSLSAESDSTSRQLARYTKPARYRVTPFLWPLVWQP